MRIVRQRRFWLGDFLAQSGFGVLAERFGVKVAPVENEEQVISWGPAGPFGIAEGGSVVWDGLGTPMYADGIATALHEMMHIVCTPPASLDQSDLDRIWEALLLIPVERQVAKAALRERLFGETAYASVLRYQLDTTISDTARLEDWKDPERTVWWKRALRRARHIGLLDDRNRPTWKRADWSDFGDPEKLSDEGQSELVLPPKYLKKLEDWKENLP